MQKNMTVSLLKFSEAKTFLVDGSFEVGSFSRIKPAGLGDDLN